MKRPINNNCEQVTFLIEKRKLAPLSIEDEQMLQLHLPGCPECRIYDHQSNIIDIVTQNIASEINPNKKLNATFKLNLQFEIDKKLGPN